MGSILTKMINQSEKLKRLDAQEALILDVTEQIWEQLETKAMTKKDLAAKLEKSPALVTQFLSGSRNMTLRTLADIAYVLDLTPTFSLTKPVDQQVDKVSVLSEQEGGWRAQTSLKQTRPYSSYLRAHNDNHYTYHVTG